MQTLQSIKPQPLQTLAKEKAERSDLNYLNMSLEALHKECHLYVKEKNIAKNKARKAKVGS